MHVRGCYLKSLSIDELWTLQGEVNSELAQRLESELEQRLRQVQGTDSSARRRSRRPTGPRRFDA